MATRTTRSHKNAHKIAERTVGSLGANYGNNKIKRNKKRSSDVGTTKSVYTTRYRRQPLADMTNSQSGTNAHGGGGKRPKNTGKHMVNVSTQSLNVLPESDLPVEESEANNNMEVDTEEEDLIDNEKIDKVDKELLAIDLADLRNPQAVSEYVQDIMVWFKRIESHRAPLHDYMKTQRDVNAKMREILIDWLSEVHHKFKLRLETMYLTVNLIDRFLSLRAVSRTKLQLVGCTAMLIASKYEEIYAPEVRDFVYISDRAYKRDEILMMESIMLNTLEFNLTVPTALRFGQRFIKLVTPPEDPKTFRFLVEYLMELTLQNYEFLCFLPSKIAASAVYLALAIVSGGRAPEWTGLLKRQTHYDVSDLKDCVIKLRALAARKPTKYKAVRKKYSEAKLNSVASIKISDICSQGANEAQPGCEQSTNNCN